ncbi:hypothetical protein ACGFZL_25000 [Streptomyces sp. NPDC048182]|uniref:hypothetical protein n=1 Tax=unclassified Streptomyces TaxID=2593676 RepID=UPI0033B76450
MFATFVLSALVLLALGGCACVYWAERNGGPRWVRVVSAMTLGASDMIRTARRNSRRRNGWGGPSGGGGD